MKFLITFIFLTYSNYLWSSAKSAFDIYQNDHSVIRYKKIAHELIIDHYFFSAIPYLNKYLETTISLDSETEKDIETLVVNTGTMAVLNLPERKLAQFNIPSVSLILGTRLFNKEEYSKAYESLLKIPDGHIFSIESNFIMGTIKSLSNESDQAIKHYEYCIEKAKEEEKKSLNANNEKSSRYYNYLKESCLIKKARIHLKNKKYELALSTYDLISKESYKWPYILIEKAWSNYYLKDFNRTLGLLVTYKSPLLEDYFFPESEVLSALSYYNLCLYDDSMKIVNYFYEEYSKKASDLKNLLGQNKESDVYFLNLYYEDAKARKNLNPFIKNLITQTKKQIKFNLDIATLKSAKNELELIRRLKNKNDFTINMAKNLEGTISFISKKINSYIKREILNFLNDIHKHSYSMFNLKLELLSKQRALIYDQNDKNSIDRLRGMEQNVTRKSNQYFFDFNGSFWADELGDYSFGLKSNCLNEGNKNE